MKLKTKKTVKKNQQTKAGSVERLIKSISL